MSTTKIILQLIAIITTTVLVTTTVWSKPPPWAPAHGYRDKQKNYDYDYGYAKALEIFDGRCVYEKAGTVLGGVVGGLVGSNVGDGDGKTIAIVAGTIIGAIIGKRVGAYFDEKDRFCTGQALEHAPNGQTVAWNNPESNAAYVVTPINSYYQGDSLCRQFIVETTTSNGVTSKKRNDACRDADEVWNTLY